MKSNNPEQKRWLPKSGEAYYHVKLCKRGFVVMRDIWEDKYYHPYRYNVQNCFKTHKEAYKLSSSLNNARNEFLKNYE